MILAMTINQMISMEMSVYDVSVFGYGGDGEDEIKYRYLLPNNIMYKTDTKRQRFRKAVQLYLISK